MKKAIVTGGAGFIGSHIVDFLVQQETEVLVVDDLSSGSEQNLSNAKSVNANLLELEVADICSEKARKAVEAFKPEVIFHQAAQMNVRRSVDEPMFDAEKNILGTINLLESGKNIGLKKFVFASTGGAIYGEQMQFPATEQHSIAPECPYGVSKRSAELYIQYFSRIHSIPSICLRYGNVYGPRQNPKGEAGVVAIFINNLLASRPLRVNGDGLQTRDFVYVDDVAGANIAAAKTKSDNIFEIFNIGLGKESTVLDIVESLKKHWSQIKHDDVVSVEFGPALKGEQRRSVIDPSKASKGLNWRPEVELDKGLSNTVKSFLKK